MDERHLVRDVPSREHPALHRTPRRARVSGESLIPVPGAGHGILGTRGGRERAEDPVNRTALRSRGERGGRLAPGRRPGNEPEDGVLFLMRLCHSIARLWVVVQVHEAETRVRERSPGVAWPHGGRRGAGGRGRIAGLKNRAVARAYRSSWSPTRVARGGVFRCWVAMWRSFVEVITRLAVPLHCRADVRLPTSQGRSPLAGRKRS